MATIIMSQVTAGAPSFPCGPCAFTCDYTGDLDVVVSGVADCPCLRSTADPRDFTVDVSACNGAFTLTKSGATWFSPSIAIFITFYVSTDGTCDTEDETIEGEAQLAATCTDDLLTWRIDGTAGGVVLVIATSDPGAIDTAIPNTAACTDGTPVAVAGTGGAATFSLP